MPRALITGIAGFAGSYLVEYLLSTTGLEISGIVHAGHPSPNLAHLRQRLTIYEGDVAEFDFVQHVMQEVRPDYIFHLAGQAAVPLAWVHPGKTVVTNIIGQLNVLESVVRCGIDPRILVVGSGEEYGLIFPSELPVTENNALRPNNPYAVSKIAQDMLGYQYFISHKLQAVRVRPFNHIGPRQSEEFVTSSFAKQIAEAELGLRGPTILVGNLETRRDFTDVRDMVRGYWLALLRGKAGEVYNLGNGRSWSMGEILDMFLSKSRVPLQVEADPDRLRPADVLDVVCDASKFRSQTGWCPEIPIEQTVEELLDYWRNRLTAEFRA
ncbi:MAG: GDP-mannose 4,6-dehydratase [Chloroflexi bacterium]|nr:GDP-mannose 4,6-dehydratase [Chloroflexota bacterium]MCL5074027.1 GDP-mannose 4,6-dehydratase [Chloroflexota bacterium]